MTRKTIPNWPLIVQRLLNEAVLGFFALLSLFLIVTPAVFTLGAPEHYVISIVENIIIFLFFAEYSCALWTAKDRINFVTNPWRIIDALIIILAVVAILPFVPDALRNSPILRLFRLGRFALLGTRSGMALKQKSNIITSSARDGDAAMIVQSLGSSGTQLDKISFESGIDKMRTDSQDWLFLSGVTERSLPKIADAMGIPEKSLHGIFQSTMPRFERLDQFTTLFVRYPLEQVQSQPLRRAPVLLISTENNVVVLSSEHTDLEQRVATRLKDLDKSTPRMARALTALFSEIIRANTDVLERFEISLSQIEQDQPALNDKKFLARTFEFRADLLKVRSSLKYLKNTIREIAEGKSVAGISTDDREVFRLLAGDASDLFEAIEDIRDSLQSLVDLRLNVSSFQMNRVMRLLALLTTLALVPATAGGLLGMNLGDAPYPGTLLQIAFGLGVVMSFSLYLFAIKGWFR